MVSGVRALRWDRPDAPEFLKMPIPAEPEEGEPEPVWLDARPCDADSLAEFPGWEPLV